MYSVTGVDIRGEGEDHVVHSGIAEDHVEVVQFPLPPIDIQIIPSNRPAPRHRARSHTGRPSGFCPTRATLSEIWSRRGLAPSVR